MHPAPVCGAFSAENNFEFSTVIEKIYPADTPKVDWNFKRCCKREVTFSGGNERGITRLSVRSLDG